MKKILTASILALSLVASANLYGGLPSIVEASENSQTVTRSGSQDSYNGPEEYFTGTVRVDPLFSDNESAPYSGAYVTFPPGARTAWHSHPTGQRLIITEGIGYVQVWGGPIEEVRAGDVVWFPPGVKHWHGASSNSAMTHIALTGVLDGKNADWMEKVSDDQYQFSRKNLYQGANARPGNPASQVSNANASQAINSRQEQNENEALTARQEKMVTIAAFTASGDLPRLKDALGEGLDAGLTVNEIKEILVQMYAYAGFPRSLNGINTFMSVLEEREAKGIKDELGKETSPLPTDRSSIELGTEIQTSLVGAPVTGPTYTFVPVIDQFLKGHLFGDIFGRDNLDFQSREIATIAALANMEGVNSQLQAHFNIGMNTGLTEGQMKSLVSVLEAEVGQNEADNAAELLDIVLSNRAK